MNVVCYYGMAVKIRILWIKNKLDQNIVLKVIC